MEFLAWLESTGVATWTRESPSILAYDSILAAHAVGMATVVGLSTGVALRVLGFAPGLPLAPMEKYFPVMFVGFWINFVSGLLLLAAYPIKAFTNPTFFIKMSAVVLAVLCLRRLRLRVFSNPANLERGILPAGSKALAGLQLFLWWTAILAGRLMAYHEIAHNEISSSIAVVAVSVLLVGGFTAVLRLSRDGSAVAER